jgi:hypothetical protein
MEFYIFGIGVWMGREGGEGMCRLALVWFSRAWLYMSNYHIPAMIDECLPIFGACMAFIASRILPAPTWTGTSTRTHPPKNTICQTSIQQAALSDDT